MFLFPTSTNSSLTRRLIKAKGFKLGKLKIKQFSNQEYYIRVKEKTAGQTVYVLGSTFMPADNILKLLLLIDALKQNKTKQINVIIPYFGYCRQDRADKPGASVAAKLMADLIKTAGADKIICVELHSEADKKFVGKKLIHISTTPLFAAYFKKIVGKDTKSQWAVASPDKGGIKRAEKMAELLKIKTVIKVYKKRPVHDVVEITQIKGEVKNKNVIIIDDIIQTGGTILQAARAFAAQGAKNIYLAATHGVFTRDKQSFASLLKKAPVKSAVITDTAPQQPGGKIKIISVVKQIAKTI